MKPESEILNDIFNSSVESQMSQSGTAVEFDRSVIYNYISSHLKSIDRYYIYKKYLFTNARSSKNINLKRAIYRLRK